MKHIIIAVLTLFCLSTNAQSIVGEWKVCGIHYPDSIDQLTMNRKENCPSNDCRETILTVRLDSLQSAELMVNNVPCPQTEPPYTFMAGSSYGFGGNWMFDESNKMISILIGEEIIVFEVNVVSDEELELKRK